MWLACPECRDESVFEQPPCAEGHGADCPEWFCVTCGHAIFDGGLELSLLAAEAAEAAAAGVDTGGRSSRTHAA